MSPLDEFLSAYDQDDNEWWRRPAGDLLNLFDALRQDRDGWRDQVVVIRSQQIAALREADEARREIRRLRALLQDRTPVPYHRFFRLLTRLRTPEPIYYWLLDRLTDNNGWRPLFYREDR